MLARRVLSTRAEHVGARAAPFTRASKVALTTESTET